MNYKASSMRGIYTALVTPFDRGAVDYASLKKLIRFQLEGGIHGFVVCGSTGEAATLTLQEKQDVFRFVVGEVGGAVPIGMGTGTNCTQETIELTARAKDLGASFAMAVVPYYNKPPQRGLLKHFLAIAENVDIPLLLYNVPSRTIAKLELETVVALSAHQNIFGIKEASGDLGIAEQLQKKCRPGFVIMSGEDSITLQMMAQGGAGGIAVLSHIVPKQFVELSDRIQSGDKTALAEFGRYQDLNSALYVESNPIPVKAALQWMGIIKSAELRLPLCELGELPAAKLRVEMQKVGLV